MEITKITKKGKLPVYDLSVADAEHYVLKNGVVTHNTGVMYSSDNVWIIGRRQEKSGTEISGYNFIINIEKSRFVKEKSKIPISVSWEGGIEKWSGLVDVAMEGGYVVKPKNGWYMAKNPANGEELSGNCRLAQTMSEDFWSTIFEETDFKAFIEKRYKVATTTMISEGTGGEDEDETT